MNTLQKILKSARKEFALHGLAGARVDRIAHRAAVNKAMIYYHFASKEKLYQAIIDEKMAALESMLESTLLREDDPEAMFDTLADFYARNFDPAGDFAPIVLRELATGGKRIRAALSTVTSRLNAPKKLKTMLDEGKQAGVFRPVDSRQALISFIGMNLFYLLFSPMVNSIWEIKDEKKFRQRRPNAVVDIFLYGIKVR